MADRVYAIGDVHGYRDKLVEVHEWIARDQARHGAGTVVHVGDLTDRGPDSRGVLDFLINGQAAGEDWVVLKGNHDRMFSLYLQAEPQRDHRLRAELDWLHPRLGGLATLASYGVDVDANPHAAARAAVPEEHLQFLSTLPTMFRADGLALVHAGIRPGVALEEQVEDDLTWIRDEFLFSQEDHGSLVVHGHTPVDEVSHHGNRVNIDTAAGYGGPLSAVVIEGNEVFQVTGNGRRLLPPPQRG
ncbi:MAG: serine/threonine protein phosphatase [Paracoccaceae bacterium]|nr:serine/threonine protein phosphatase [Paracoccaceae bacterium]